LIGPYRNNFIGPSKKVNNVENESFFRRKFCSHQVRPNKTLTSSHLNQNKYIINQQRFLGEGAEGKVLFAQNEKTKENVAIKCVKYSSKEGVNFKSFF
jgi:hypothetical protein